MPTKQKTWTEKLGHPEKPHLTTLPKSIWGAQAGDVLLISTPNDIKSYIEKIRPGETTSVQAMRADLAGEKEAATTCPLTTGIFLRIVAEAALERLELGEEPTPFWRVVDPKSPLAKKLSCGPDWIASKRLTESR